MLPAVLPAVAGVVEAVRLARASAGNDGLLSVPATPRAAASSPPSLPLSPAGTGLGAALEAMAARARASGAACDGAASGMDAAPSRAASVVPTPNGAGGSVADGGLSTGGLPSLPVLLTVTHTDGVADAAAIPGDEDEPDDWMGSVQVGPCGCNTRCVRNGVVLHMCSCAFSSSNICCGLFAPLYHCIVCSSCELY